MSKSPTLSSSDHSTRSGPDLRPLVVRTSGSATEAVYVFWMAHVRAHLLGRGVSEGPGPTRAETARALREPSSAARRTRGEALLDAMPRTVVRRA